MNKRKFLIQTAIGLIIISLLFYFIKPSELIPVIKTLNPIFLILSIITYFAMHFMYVHRLKIIFNYSKKVISSTEIFKAHFAGMLASDFTPARTGYFLTPFLLSKKVGVESGFSAIMVSQFTIFVAKIILAPIALFYIATTLELPTAIILILVSGIVIVGFIAVLIALALWTKKSSSLMKFFSRFKIFRKYVEKFHYHLNVFQKESNKIKRVVPKVTILSILILIGGGVRWMFLSYAFGYPLSLLTCIFLDVLITITQFVPITPAGLGIQESGGIVLLALFGFAAGDALAFVLIYRVLMMLTHTIGIKELTKKGTNILEQIPNDT